MYLLPWIDDKDREDYKMSFIEAYVQALYQNNLKLKTELQIFGILLRICQKPRGTKIKLSVNDKENTWLFFF